jgi:NAD(P)-dependent dehydrogenase (short-subunit alcohol dehydrogenase family)
MNTNQHWTKDNIPDLQGKTAIVTGANSGLGFEDTKALAAKGAHVVMACRNLEKAEAAADTIQREIPGASLKVQLLDLASLESIRDFAREFNNHYDRLEILINNAGLMAIPQRKTADGFEMQFGTNHLGHFALTGLLLVKLLAAETARIVTVSSDLHKQGRVNFEDLNSEREYNKWAAYGQSKLANLLFAYELQRRLERVQTNVISVASHPGYAATNLQRKGPEMSGASLQGLLMSLSNLVFAQSAEKGALPTLYAATAPGVKGGEYYGPGGFLGMRGYPEKVQSSERSYDNEVAERLWEVSEQLTGVHIELEEAKAI